MKLPPSDILDVLLDEVGEAADSASASVLRRACRLAEQAERGERDLGVTDRAEMQMAEAWMLANGLWTPALNWPSEKMQDLFGPILAGEVWVIGGATGNGKSALVVNLLEDLRQRPDFAGVTVFPLEQSAAVLRTQQACLRLGYPIAPVFRQRWGFGEGRVGVGEAEGRAALRRELHRMVRPPERERLRYVDADVLTAAGLVAGMEAAADWHHRLVIVDHLHHMDHGRGPLNEGVRATMRVVKAAAKRLGIGVLMLAQTGRPDKRDQRRPFFPPQLSDLQASSAIEQVADVVGFLYRPLLATVKMADLDDVILGRREWASVFEPQTMGLICPKHRLDGQARGGRIALDFRAGRLTDWGPTAVPLPVPPPVPPPAPRGVALDEGAGYGPDD